MKERLIRNNLNSKNVEEVTFYIASVVGMRYINEQLYPDQGFLHDILVIAIPNTVTEESELKDAAIYAFCEAYSDIVVDQQWRFQVEIQKLNEIVQSTTNAIQATIEQDQFGHVRKALKLVD